MADAKRPRGRPPKPGAPSAAERSRAHLAALRAIGGKRIALDLDGAEADALARLHAAGGLAHEADTIRGLIVRAARRLRSG
jgi:hypothetical protein